MTAPVLTHEIYARIPEGAQVTIETDGAGDQHLSCKVVDTSDFYDFVKELEAVASRLLAV